jgi:hypothetical protein
MSTDPASSRSESAAFEAELRSHRELMRQMADREHWEATPVWARVGRAIAQGTLYVAAFAGAAFIVWLLIYVITNM